MSRPPTSPVVGNCLSTSSDACAARQPDETAARFEAKVTPDGRIDSLTTFSADGRRRSVQPLSREGLAVLIRGDNIEYRFDEERRLRKLPYLSVLDSMRQEILLTAHKARHGELLDEPDVVPALKELLVRIEETREAFHRACEASTTDV
jgi:hypothetical protein